jgi:hypothetical protein
LQLWDTKKAIYGDITARGGPSSAPDLGDRIGYVGAHAEVSTGKRKRKMVLGRVIVTSSVYL